MTYKKIHRVKKIMVAYDRESMKTGGRVGSNCNLYNSTVKVMKTIPQNK